MILKQRPVCRCPARSKSIYGNSQQKPNSLQYLISLTPRRLNNTLDIHIPSYPSFGRHKFYR